jgi:hypothetical protein
MQQRPRANGPGFLLCDRSRRLRPRWIIADDDNLNAFYKARRPKIRSRSNRMPCDAVLFDAKLLQAPTSRRSWAAQRDSSDRNYDAPSSSHGGRSKSAPDEAVARVAFADRVLAKMAALLARRARSSAKAGSLGCYRAALAFDHGEARLRVSLASVRRASGGAPFVGAICWRPLK